MKLTDIPNIKVIKAYYKKLFKGRKREEDGWNRNNITSGYEDEMCGIINTLIHLTGNKVNEKNLEKMIELLNEKEKTIN